MTTVGEGPKVSVDFMWCCTSESSCVGDTIVGESVEYPDTSKLLSSYYSVISRNVGSAMDE